MGVADRKQTTASIGAIQYFSIFFRPASHYLLSIIWPLVLVAHTTDNIIRLFITRMRCATPQTAATSLQKR